MEKQQNQDRSVIFLKADAKVKKDLAPRRYEAKYDASPYDRFEKGMGSRSFAALVKKPNVFISNIEVLGNRQRCDFMELYHTTMGTKYSGVFAGKIKGVREYARLFGDRDWNKATYVTLNERFHTRTDVVYYLRDLVDRKQDLKPFMKFFGLIAENKVDNDTDYTYPVTRGQISRMLQADRFVVLRVLIGSNYESEERFISSKTEYEWLLGLGVRFYAYSDKEIK
jgi:hypothetical protein